MKRMLVMALALMMLVGIMSAYADDLGIQIIGGDNAASNAVSLDDIQLGTSYTIDGYATVTPIELLTVDFFAQFGENEDYRIRWNSDDGKQSFATVFTRSDSACDWYAERYIDAGWMDSGENADFLWLRIDVTNLKKSAFDFSEDTTIKVVYQDDYEFAGWIRQIDYDKINLEHGDGCVTRYTFDKSLHPAQIVLDPAKIESVDMMYTGHYVFGCTLPNAVITDKQSPLRIEIKMGDNDLTFNIRK